MKMPGKGKRAATGGLRAQPRPTPRPKRGASRPQRRQRVGGRGARRPGTPLRQRVGRRLPSIRRLLAGVGAVAVAAGLVALLSGPWLRITEVTWAGDAFTRSRDLERILEPQRGTNLLALDTTRLHERLTALPAVAGATVRASLPGSVEVTLVERDVAFVWQTASGDLLGAADGTIFAEVDRGAAAGDVLADAPRIGDERSMARLMAVGDEVPAIVLDTALRLADLDPAALGSEAGALTVRIDDEYGFGVRSDDPGWELAFGAFGIDPRESADEAAARLERQITAVRTLFASRPEAEIAWVDARNPGKVYFRAKG